VPKNVFRVALSLLALAAFVATALAQDEQPADATVPVPRATIGQEEAQKRITELLGQQDVDEAERTRLVELYRQLVQRLQAEQSFIERGVPGVQIFTSAHEDYHRPGDVAEKVDVAGLVKIATFVKEAAVYLGEREEPMTVTIEGQAAATAQAAPRPGGRRVSFGSVPDFAFPGPGVRIQQVLPDSPAEAAGIAAGDVLVAIDGEEVTDLRSYSEILKRHEPGDEIELILERGDERVTVRAVLKAR